jgi:hypothetical protein
MMNFAGHSRGISCPGQRGQSHFRGHAGHGGRKLGQSPVNGGRQGLPCSGCG